MPFMVFLFKKLVYEKIVVYGCVAVMVFSYVCALGTLFMSQQYKGVF